MLRIAICDDEELACQSLEKDILAVLNPWKICCEISCFFCADDLLKTECIFDLFFLDIQMPKQDGLILAKKMRENKIEGLFIFATALKEHVYDAFEVEAFDYLCKPINKMLLEKTLHRAVKKLKDHKFLFIKTMHWSKTIYLREIFYCEVINRKIYLHTKYGIVDFYAKLTDIEKQLDYRFIQCHRSYLVNLDYILEYVNGQIQLENGEKIPVSRSRHQEFMEVVMSYMKRMRG